METRFAAGGADATWEPGPRTVHVRFDPRARPDAEDARAMQAWIDATVGEGTWRVLVDLEHADHATLAWRYRWLAWTYVRRRRLRIAVLHAHLAGPSVLRAFAKATGVRVEGFRSEADARAWLVELAEPI